MMGQNSGHRSHTDWLSAQGNSTRVRGYLQEEMSFLRTHSLSDHPPQTRRSRPWLFSAGKRYIKYLSKAIQNNNAYKLEKNCK